MPYFCLEKIERALNDAGKPVRGSRILDPRRRLQGRRRRHARVAGAEDHRAAAARAAATSRYHDPHVPELPAARAAQRGAGRLRPCDLAVIVTAHPGVDHGASWTRSPAVLDLRGVTRGLRDAKVQSEPRASRVRRRPSSSVSLRRAQPSASRARPASRQERRISPGRSGSKRGLELERARRARARVVSSPGADVVGAGDVALGGGEKRRDDVADVDEVARLAPVAEDVAPGRWPRGAGSRSRSRRPRRAGPGAGRRRWRGAARASRGRAGARRGEVGLGRGLGRAVGRERGERRVLGRRQTGRRRRRSRRRWRRARSGACRRRAPPRA